MSDAQKYFDNAENCVELAENAKDAPTRARYKRMAEAWFALAKEQKWFGTFRRIPWNGPTEPLAVSIRMSMRQPV
jgi:hypothetical protein